MKTVGFIFKPFIFKIKQLIFWINLKNLNLIFTVLTILKTSFFESKQSLILSISVLGLVLITGLWSGFFVLSNAEVLDFNINPESPFKGDLVTIYGNASSNEEVRIKISFEKIIPVENGRYIFSISGVKIPEGKNVFSVTAYDCKNLRVGVKLLLIWITLSSDAKNGIATISQSNVPPGSYDIIIYGESDKNSVKLKITAIGFVKADENGSFSYSYETSSIPAGDFVISAGGISKTVTLKATPTPIPEKKSPTPSLNEMNKTKLKISPAVSIPGFETTFTIVAFSFLFILYTLRAMRR